METRERSGRGRHVRRWREGSDYVVEDRQVVAASPAAAFVFFADPSYLPEITPPWLGFRVLTAVSGPVCAGMNIDYTLRWLRAPIRWRTLITACDAPHWFSDTQVRGPYALWEHEHRFVPLGAGDETLMTDVIRYRLPLGPAGRLAHAAIVRRQLDAILDYRARAVVRRFGPPAHAIADAPAGA